MIYGKTRSEKYLHEAAVFAISSQPGAIALWPVPEAPLLLCCHRHGIEGRSGEIDIDLFASHNLETQFQ